MRWRLRATLDIHAAVLGVLRPVITAYVNAMKAVWLHRDTGIRAYPATETHETGLCPLCDGTGWADDPSACSDPEHCSPGVPCPNGCVPESFDNDPFPERKIENWANQAERESGKPFPP